ncbi:MAG: 23S rRNA (guanosine(2251)-2'-O)-methyltransferase RlmB [Ruminococcaceae bacterium]|nr:23S rRNA (guanosine(2251)-2'-O)-methyltransferase RlmB [Oscillospiraceae bacterium]
MQNKRPGRPRDKAPSERKAPYPRERASYPREKAPAVRENAPSFDETNLIEGRHAVTEALRSGRTIDKIHILFGSTDAALAAIKAKASAMGITVNECDRQRLDAMSTTGVHQGVIAVAAAHEYAELSDILDAAREAGEAPLIVVCDGINDPHNLGAIIRTAGAAGAHGVVIPKHRSVGLTATVAKAAVGALEYVPVARVPNMTSALKELQDAGVWIYGTSDRATDELYSTDLTGPAAIVIGSEGDGISRLVGDTCDFMLSIPMKGKIASLNASNAAAVVLFEAVRQRTTR